MRLKQLATDDDAVSPVIGVILMVAITVILAAVIASFVLGLGGQTQTTPQASFGWEYDGTPSDHELTITHESGESIKSNELFVRGESTSGTDLDAEWSSIGQTSTSIGSQSAVASGDSATIQNGTVGSKDIGNDYDLRIIWQPEEGDTSATLGEDTGPDA